MINLIDFLKWDDSFLIDSCSNKLSKLFLGHQIDKLSSILNKEPKNNNYFNILDKLFSLNEASMRKVILAPEMTYRMGNCNSLGVESVFKFLSTSVDIESGKLSKQCGNGEFGCWSALGDIYLPNCINSVDPLTSDSWIKDLSERHVALKTPEGIVIDFDSPFAKRKIYANNFRPEFASTIEISTPERLNIETKICDASTFLRLNSPEAANFVKSFIYVLFPRIDNGIKGFQGSSNRDFIGRSNLINPHIKGITSDNIASSLVHEAVHIFTNIIELWIQPSNNLTELYSPNKVSPWTNQKLNLLAFIHASFVWYALKNLWELIELRTGYKSNVSNYYIMTASKGFKKKSYLNIIQENKKIINSWYFEQLCEIPNEI